MSEDCENCETRVGAGGCRTCAQVRDREQQAERDAEAEAEQELQV